ncbi:MAG: bifunctional metallophosphatase/5'-nucleotidase [Clostridia bacterium]|nr:bifunctional metallophosphatase/5'-nucleotidase [Clostridia bacterium]
MKKPVLRRRYRPLTLLHSNDLHGDFLTENLDEKLVGGVSLLSGYVNKARAEQPNTLYCIAGDMFRGSVIDSEFHGISTIEIMNMLLPDVVTIGNHETDYGVAHLLFLEKCAKFPIINANMFIRNNHARLFEPYTIIGIDGMKILFIGVLTEEVLAQTRKDDLIGTLVDIDDAAEEVGRICNAYNSVDIDFTVLLTHIGFEEDKKLAAKLDPAWGVDVIIGGHSHTLLEEPAKVNDILIVQAGVGTDQIGRFDLTVDTVKNCVADWKWQCVPITSENCPADTELERLITQYKDKTDAKYSRMVTRLNRRLTHPSRTCETELGGLFADALQESLGLDVMLLASGSIRAGAMEPIVLLSDLLEAFPYDDPVMMLNVTGAQLQDMLLYMMRDEVWEGIHCEFYQFSQGLRVVYDRSTHEMSEFSFRDRPIDPRQVFRIGLQMYHFNNMDLGFGVSHTELERSGGKARMIATSCRDILDEYLSTHRFLDHEAGERLIVR